METKPFRSVSQLNSFSSCPKQFELEKLDKVPSRPAAWTVRGTAVHSTIEAWEKSARDIDILDYLHVKAWPEAFEEKRSKYPDLSKWIKTPQVKTTERDLELRLKDSVQQVTRYCSRALAEEDQWEVLANEVEFSFEFHDIILRGKIDQIRRWKPSGLLTVVDVKTGGDDTENPRQLAIYIQGGQKEGFDVHHGQYWYTKLDRASQWFYNLDKIYTLDYLHRSYSMLNLAIDSGIFIPAPAKDKCAKFCPVKEFCPEWTKK